jgi:hypothetical protein
MFLSPAEQQEIRDSVQSLRSRFPELARQIRQAECYAGAIRIITRTLGASWCDKHAKPSPPAGAHDFLRINFALGSTGMHAMRVIALADYLTTLADVPNFGKKMEELSRKGLEETFYELRVARSLQRRGCLVKFLVESRVKGKDFDLEGLVGSQPIFVEAKCVTDEPPYRRSLLSNILRKAAPQLPSEGGGIIFVMLPFSWVLHETFWHETKSTVASVLRNNSRVNAIFLHREEWSPGPPFVRDLSFYPTLNIAPKIDIPDIQTLLEATAHRPEGPGDFLDVSYI